MSSAERFDAPLPPAGAGAAFTIPKLDVTLYDRAVFTMPLTGKLTHAKITIYFSKLDAHVVYICNTQALAVLWDVEAEVAQRFTAAFLSRNEHFKKARF